MTGIYTAEQHENARFCTGIQRHLSPSRHQMWTCAPSQHHLTRLHGGNLVCLHPSAWQLVAQVCGGSAGTPQPGGHTSALTLSGRAEKPASGGAAQAHRQGCNVHRRLHISLHSGCSETGLGSNEPRQTVVLYVLNRKPRRGLCQSQAYPNGLTWRIKYVWFSCKDCGFTG